MTLSNNKGHAVQMADTICGHLYNFKKHNTTITDNLQWSKSTYDWQAILMETIVRPLCAKMCKIIGPLSKKK